MNKTESIKIGSIVTDLYQPRKLCEGIEDLARSIESSGLINPIIVRKTKAGELQLICGERRLKACVRLGWTTIDATIVSGISDRDAEIMALADNIEREDLSPFEQSDWCARMAGKISVDEIAAKTGRSKVWISKRLAVAALPETVRANKAFASAPFAALMSFARLPETARASFVGRMSRAGSAAITVADVKNFERNLGQELSDQTFDKTECQSCSKCSLVQSDLFGDGEEQTAICYDPACMAEKRNADILSGILKIIKKSKCVLDWSFYSIIQGKQFLRMGDYIEVEDNPRAKEMWSLFRYDKEPVKRMFVNREEEQAFQKANPAPEEDSEDSHSSPAPKKTPFEKWAEGAKEVDDGLLFSFDLSACALLCVLSTESLVQLIDSIPANLNPVAIGMTGRMRMEELGEILSDAQFKTLLDLLGE